MTEAARTSVWVDVSADVAFAVFTEDVDRWWRRGPAFRFGAEGTLSFEPLAVGGSLVERFPDRNGGGEWRVGTIREWQPGVQLRFDFRLDNFSDDQSTEVLVTFSEERGGTRVTVPTRAVASSTCLEVARTLRSPRTPSMAATTGST